MRQNETGLLRLHNSLGWTSRALPRNRFSDKVRLGESLPGKLLSSDDFADAAFESEPGEMAVLRVRRAGNKKVRRRENRRRSLSASAGLATLQPESARMAHKFAFRQVAGRVICLIDLMKA